MSATEAVENQRLPIDVGIILAGKLSHAQKQLIERAGREAREMLDGWFGEFAWHFQLIQRPNIASSQREESSQLLVEADNERDLHQWDFALLVTDAELIGRYRPFVLAALSRPFDSAIISISRIEASKASTAEAPDDAALQNRICTLMLHAIGHLGGLSQSEDQNALLFHPDDADNLDPMVRYSNREIRELGNALREIADTRLEETESNRDRWSFGLRAIWINRGEIMEAIVAARPWEFPRRLGRLTTAAVSAVALLLMTAEGWDLGLNQSLMDLTLLALGSLLITTIFVATRQRLLVRRRKRLTEQTVVTQTSAILIVVAGLTTTWLAMFLLCWIAAMTFFPDTLVSEWAGSAELSRSQVTFSLFGRMSFFAASIGLLIGSLGASFEEQHHFQHVIFVDEEI